MKWRRVADKLEQQAKALVDEQHPPTQTALLSQGSPQAQLQVAAARVAAAIVLASLAKALREGIAGNHFPGGK